MKSDQKKNAEGIGAALISVLGRLLLAFFLWVAVVAFIQVSPYAHSAPMALFLAVNIGKLLLPIFVLWPMLEIIYRKWLRHKERESVGEKFNNDSA
jgi:hypothetical protein